MKRRENETPIESTVMDITYMDEERHGFATIQPSPIRTEHSPINSLNVSNISRPPTRQPAKVDNKLRHSIESLKSLGKNP